MEEATEKPTFNLAGGGQAIAVCRCGNRFEGNEKFCGKCGTARFAESRREMQSKWASLWYLQQAKATESKPDEDSKQSREEIVPAGPPASLEEIVTKFTDAQTSEPESHRREESRQDASLKVTQPVADAAAGLEARSKAETEQTIAYEVKPVKDPAKPERLDSDLNAGTAIVPAGTVPTQVPSQTLAIEPLPRASALRAWEWWRKLKRPDRGSLAAYWNRHRANVWIAISVVLLMTAILTNNTAGPQPANPNANRKHPGAPSLTLFERLLVSLGIAEAPPPPAYYGNPAAKVWIDVHTALYYCPGADLYGKTDGGRVTTQKDAQQDQFEPADRRACD